MSSSYNFLEFDTISSTNTYAKQLAKKGEGEATVVISKTQTDGKGQFGRSFYSPENNGIYMSVILRPNISLVDCQFITIAAAVAVCEAVKKLTENTAQIKWVNDIYLNSKKICGILTETVVDTASKKPEFVILGIGLNLTRPQSDFPDEIKNIAGVLFEKDDNIDKRKIAKTILDNFFHFYKSLENKLFLQKYRELSLLTNKRVSFVYGGNQLSGIALGIDDNANLLVELENGKKLHLTSGKASVKID